MHTQCIQYWFIQIPHLSMQQPSPEHTCTTPHTCTLHNTYSYLRTYMGLRALSLPVQPVGLDS